MHSGIQLIIILEGRICLIYRCSFITVVAEAVTTVHKLGALSKTHSSPKKSSETKKMRT
jgi:hypothetical protein